MIPAKRWLSHTWQCLELKAESACRGAAVSASAPPTPEGRKPSWAFWSCLSGGNCHCCPASVLCLSPRDFGLSPHPDPSEFITPPATCQVRVRRGTPNLPLQPRTHGMSLLALQVLEMPTPVFPRGKDSPATSLGSSFSGLLPMEKANEPTEPDGLCEFPHPCFHVLLSPR